MKKLLLNIVLFLAFLTSFVSCTPANEDVLNEVIPANVEVTFTLNVEDDMFKYYMLDGAWNNNSFTDACTSPICNDEFTVTYNTGKQCIGKPILFAYGVAKTNRPVDKDFTVKCLITIKKTVCEKTTVEYIESYVNLNAENQSKYLSDSRTRCYVVTFDNNWNYKTQIPEYFFN